MGPDQAISIGAKALTITLTLALPLLVVGLVVGVLISIVQAVTKPGDTFCAPCSRMRRGILYATAERLGCNKIALGHHRDDALETFLMNLFYTGKPQSMP